MDCCATKAPDTAPLAACPSCDARGRRVPVVTLAALVYPEVERREEGYRFCATPGCDVAWYGEASGHVLSVTAARVRIGQKETAPDRHLCYCFGHTARDIEDEVEQTGVSTVFDTIAERCKAGEDRCPTTNPQGSCCLGNVRTAATTAVARHRSNSLILVESP